MEQRKDLGAQNNLSSTTMTLATCMTGPRQDPGGFCEQDLGSLENRLCFSVVRTAQELGQGTA